jgi:hypothetical protein
VALGKGVASFCAQLSSRVPSTGLSHPSVELLCAFWNEGYYLRIHLYPAAPRPDQQTCRRRLENRGWRPGFSMSSFESFRVVKVIYVRLSARTDENGLFKILRGITRRRTSFVVLALPSPIAIRTRTDSSLCNAPKEPQR